MKMNNNIKDILIGCLLGDAYIGKVDKNKAFMTFEQGIIHEDYVKDLHSTLNTNGVNCMSLKYYSRKDSRYNDKINESIYFKTHNLESLYYIADMFLQENKKVIPKDIKEHLTPKALAYWICDDGQQVKKGGITLCTDKFTMDEITLLIEALTEKYDVKCSIHHKKGRSGTIYNRIYIYKESLERIEPLIIPHLYKTFLYKIHVGQ